MPAMGIGKRAAGFLDEHDCRSVIPGLAQPIDNRLELSFCEPQDGVEIGLYPRRAALESSDHWVVSMRPHRNAACHEYALRRDVKSNGIRTLRCAGTISPAAATRPPAQTE